MVSGFGGAVVVATLALVGAGAGASAAGPAGGSAPVAGGAVHVTGELVLRPPIGQDGAGRSTVPAVAAFTPARTGAAVEIQRRDGAGWSTIAAGAQDAAGEFGALLPAATVDGDAEYRAKTRVMGRDRPAVTPVTRASPWRSVWDAEFEGDALSGGWSLLPIGARSRPCATATPDTVEVGGGIARFFARANGDVTPYRTERCPDGQFRNAQFGTSRLFTYGIFAARLRTQVPEGMHAGFWLYPAGPAPKDVPPDDLPGHRGVEIDVMEYFGDTYGSAEDAGKTWAYVYLPRRQDDGTIRQVKVGGPQDTRDILGPDLPSAGYHVYSVEWTPGEYIFRVDGVETMRIDQGISHRPQMIRLSMLTSAWETPRLRTDSLPASLDVDWVRVWQE